MSTMAFPHMKIDEAQTWNAFLQVMPWTPLRIEYDLRLGEGALLPEDTPDWVRRMAFSLSTKRVDAVVHTRDVVYLVEVKDRASLGAVGQLLGYDILYRKARPGVRNLRLVLVCRGVAPDMEDVLRQHRIELFIVPALPL